MSDRRANAPASNPPVPMLDVTRENRRVRDEIDSALRDVCDSGAFVHGKPCRDFEEALADYCGVEHAVGCASGSDALLLALMGLEIGPGDEVILPSFTFFATASAVWRLGAKPVFADIVPETFLLDPHEVAKKRTKATKAVIPVHLFGQCVDMRALRGVVGDLPIIEDAAQAIGAAYGGERAGSLGQVGCFSFYPTKNLGGFGDGGMLTTPDAKLAARLRILRDHGQEPRYYHHFVGINSRLDTLQAAVLQVKLTHLDQWAARRRAHAERYRSEFRRLRLDSALGLPAIAPDCEPVWNQFTIRVPEGRRDALLKHLSDQQIGAAIYYPVPLHLQDCFATLGHGVGDFPAAERASQEVLSLPIYAELEPSEQDCVIWALADFFQENLREHAA